MTGSRTLAAHAAPEAPANPASPVDPRLHNLQHAIDHAAHLLPAQGPITVFIHHNTLHAFEDLSFTDAVKEAGKVFGCQPYMTAERYREELGRGRIRFGDLQAVLHKDLGERAQEKVVFNCTRFDLRLAMLQYPLRSGPTAELLWFVAETDALRRFRSDVAATDRGQLISETHRWVMRDLRASSEEKRTAAERRGTSRVSAGLVKLIERFGEASIETWSEDVWEAFTLQALWRVCCNGVATVPEASLPPLPSRHRDLLFLATGADADLLVNEVLIRFCGAFLDQGLSCWQLPAREEGFYGAFCQLYRQPAGPPDRWLRGLSQELNRWREHQVTPLAAIRESLDRLGVPEEAYESYLSTTLLSLRGWGGMLRVLEERGDRAVRPIPNGSLVEFLAIRLLLDRLALEFTARQTIGYEGSLAELRDELRKRLGPRQAPSIEQRAFLVFQLAQVLDWTPERLYGLDEKSWATLIEEIEVFSAIERRRIFHLAYERRFRTQTLDALALHNRNPRPQPQTPRFQAMFCIDEREESMRRHLEEVAPDVVTFSLAGFYFVGMYYRGAADAHFVPLCPIVIRPQHWVTENVLDNQADAHQRTTWKRRALGRASHQVHLGSRTFAQGAVLSAALGVLAGIPLIARTLFPRLTARIRQACGQIVLSPPATRLQLERSEPTPGPEGAQVGFVLEELVAIAERVLRDTGLTSNFARLIVTLGHGSSSMNNPHESAYNCGACGGARGGPNGRAIAQILNDPRVRQALQARGLTIPAETVFVGGMHNTSNDSITFFDLDRLPASHQADFEAARVSLDRARERNAHERCRRFMSAPLTMSFSTAQQHVEGRAEDLAQVRPELGHATNAIVIVGRRQRTRGLFLDRRAFLNCYDLTQDDAQATILTRILMAAVPVCAGINLEYYFSYVDNAGFGCGTKLPHNVAALLGVMDGAASDLRTGLPWQMLEIHEPIRILFVIENTPERMLQIMEKQPMIGRLIRNGWVQLATLDPHSPRIQLYENGAFHDYQPEAQELPRATSSVEWYRGWRDHLEFAAIDG